MVRRGVSSTRASRRWASTPEARTGCSVRGTRAAIRAWQSSRGVRATGYLDGAASGARCGRPADRERLLLLHRLVRFRRSSRPWRQRPRRRRRRSWRVLFWQSVMDSTNPAAARADATGSPGAGFAGTLAAGVGAAAGADARAEPGEVFRDCEVCPEMVVMPGSRLALGRYEVTVCEYRASLVGEPSDCPASSFSPRSRCVRFMPAIVDHQGNGNPVAADDVKRHSKLTPWRHRKLTPEETAYVDRQR